MLNEELFEAQRELLREDELLVVQGRVKLDRFSGGLRLDVAQLWDLAGARARFGRYLAVAVNGVPLPSGPATRHWPVGAAWLTKATRASSTADCVRHRSPASLSWPSVQSGVADGCAD